jgi:glycosyltransferase involved in cell wall biosynthesis
LSFAYDAMSEGRRLQQSGHPRVLATFDDLSGCTMYRVLMPYAALQHTGFVAHWVPKAELPKADTAFYDLLVFPRFGVDTAEKAHALMNIIECSGRLLVYEIDDDLFHVPEHNPVAKHFTKERIDGMRAMMARCHAVVTTNEHLARQLRQVNPSVYVVPNAVDPQLFRGAKQSRTIPELTVGVAGSATHVKDWAILGPVWREIAQRHPDVHFVTVGYCPDYLEQAVPAGRLHRIDWCKLAQYSIQMGNIDISCCPLLDDHFNASKTPIKALESALAGAAVVASPLLYRQVIRHGHTGLLAETQADWVAALDRLIRHRKLRRQLADALNSEARGRYSIGNAVGLWEQTFRSIYHEHQAKLHPPEYERANQLAEQYSDLLQPANIA